ncbi:hypothetical protein HX063_06065 [Myroides odoratimimus]|uniref:hypothetical protein n=1 Tax=Myroides odoratimimus TaxID=76832 RepID=UPI0025783742|nr:hypothetical protein [Myroides odoratimimus]MDM1494978.1 hypothetical protein [Myroides odoratimimus]
MGYRTYIGFLPKEEYNKIKSMTLKELFEYKGEDYNEDDIYENGHVGVYDLGTELYEFGKYTDFTPPETSVKQFFEKEDIKEYYSSDNDLHIVTKEFLAYIIDYYSLKVQKYQQEMLVPFFPDIIQEKYPRKNSDFLNSTKSGWIGLEEQRSFDFEKITQEEQNALYKIIEHMKQMHFDWAHNRRPYNLEKGTSVCNSCKYEYAVFELVRLYKTFDWENNEMYYYGY